VLAVALKVAVPPGKIEKGGKMDALGVQLAVSSERVEFERLVIWKSTVDVAVMSWLEVSMSASGSAPKQATNEILQTTETNAIAIRMSCSPE
jgi:hypothetical protein